MIEDSPCSTFSVPLLNKNQKNGELPPIAISKEEIQGPISCNEVQPSSSRHHIGKRSGFLNQKPDLTVVDLNSNQKLDANIRSPDEGSSVALTPVCASELTDAAHESTDLSGRGRRRTSSRLSTLVSEGIRHSLGRLPTFVRINSVPLYGEKTIGQTGSIIYLINQIFGAGILALPYVVKASGWLPSFFANILVCLVAMFGTLMIMRCMTMIPGNQNFERRVEYIPTVEFFLGKRFRFWTELCFYLSIQSLNVVSIAVVAQSVDHLLLRAFGMTAGVVLNPSQAWPITLQHFYSQEEVDHIYSGGNGLIFGITIGYLINATLCILLSTQTMNENMKIQYVSFAFLITSIGQISGAAAMRIWYTVAPKPSIQLATPSIYHRMFNYPILDPLNSSLAVTSSLTSSMFPYRNYSNFTDELLDFRQINEVLASPIANLTASVLVPAFIALSATLPLLSTQQDPSSHPLNSSLLLRPESMLSTSSVLSISRSLSSPAPNLVSLDFSNISLYSTQIPEYQFVEYSSHQLRTNQVKQFRSLLLNETYEQPSSFVSDRQHTMDPNSSSFTKHHATVHTNDSFEKRFSSDSRTSEQHQPSMSLSEQSVRSTRTPSPCSTSVRPVIVQAPSIFGDYQYGQLLSTFIASYSYVNVIPSWANEMTPSVRVNSAVWSSSAFSCSLYYIFGYLLAYAYPTVHTDNVLQEVLADEATGAITKFSIYIFNLLTVLPGILVYSITTRYNLVNSNQTTPRNGFMIGCVIPFGFAWLLANDEYFSAVLQWSSLLFSLAVNFVIPSIVYLRACETQRLATRNPTRHFQTMHSYATRAKLGVTHMMSDVSAQLREYLRSLPPSELDPYLQLLLSQQPSPTSRSPRQSIEYSAPCTNTPANSSSFPAQLGVDGRPTISPFDSHCTDARLGFGHQSKITQQHHLVPPGRQESNDETNGTIFGAPVTSWTSEPTPSNLPERNHRYMQQETFLNSSVSSQSSFSALALSVDSNRRGKESMTTPIPPDDYWCGDTSFDRPLEPFRSNTSHLQSNIIERSVGELLHETRPRTFSIKIPTDVSHDEAKSVVSASSTGNPQGSEQHDTTAISCPLCSDMNRSGLPQCDHVTRDTVVVPSSQTLSTDLTPLSINEVSSGPSIEMENETSLSRLPTGVFSSRVLSTASIVASSTLHSNQFPDPSNSEVYTSEPTRTISITTSPDLSSPHSASQTFEARHLPYMLSSLSEDNTLYNLSTGSSPRTQIGKPIGNRGGHGIGSMQLERGTPEKTRRHGTAPDLGRRQSILQHSKQVRFGKSSPNENDRDEAITFEKLSTRVLEMLNEFDHPKEPSQQRLWKHVVGPFLASSLSFSRFPETSSFEDESRSSRILIRNGSDSPIHGREPNSSTYRYSMLRGQTVGFLSSPFFSHEHDLAASTPFRRWNSFSPTNHESLHHSQSWKPRVKRGITLLVPASGEVPAITITPTPEPTPKLAPSDMFANPLLRLYSSELSPTASLHSSSSSCALPILSRSATFDLGGSSLQNDTNTHQLRSQRATRVSSSRSRRHRLESVDETSEVSDGTSNSCPSSASARSSRGSSWDRQFFNHFSTQRHTLDGSSPSMPPDSHESSAYREEPNSLGATSPDGSTLRVANDLRRNRRLPSCLLRDIAGKGGKKGEKQRDEIEKQETATSEHLERRLLTLPSTWKKSGDSSTRVPTFGTTASDIHLSSWIPGEANDLQDRSRSRIKKSSGEFNSPLNRSRKESVDRIRNRKKTKAMAGGGQHGYNYGTFLAPPPAALSELPVDPPVDLMIVPVEGAEDAYECDEEPATGKLDQHKQWNANHQKSKTNKDSRFPQGGIENTSLIDDKNFDGDANRFSTQYSDYSIVGVSL